MIKATGRDLRYAILTVLALIDMLTDENAQGKRVLNGQYKGIILSLQDAKAIETLRRATAGKVPGDE